jgi:hypothetical protein
MPEVTGTPQTEQQAPAHALHLNLNTDGQRHPALNAAAVITFIAGVAGFALGLVVQAHLVATILGIAAFALGMVAQMLSANTTQRVFIVAGIIAGAVGAGLGIAHGGFG